ncbi:hypothetical protein LX64_01696 [Chitinophaga skermanii]|uniref:Uncharacterized protein n=1 Tax=Chitinophaga skermanii TaxID=331697 RepID=A0A327QPR4_9BACT|nr:hypothetical protein [Chitinophaga skermanii]RAJ06569.1 hypothetical protein LX64_01696 [Chitinophaga skermanii]
MQYIAPRFILRYILLTVLFMLIFYYIKPLYLVNGGPCTGPIDVHPSESYGHFFDAAYVIKAKNACYILPRFYYTYFIVDLIFPLLYTALFASAVKTLEHPGVQKTLFFFLLIGMGFDYLENFSFAIFLQLRSNSLAGFVAACSTFKTVFYVMNSLVCMVLILRYFATRIFGKRQTNSRHLRR